MRLTEEQLKLIEENIDLPKVVCFSMRAKFYNNPSLAEECECVATEYLCKAACNFNEEKGKFKTYASKSIRLGVWSYLKGELAHGMSGISTLNAKDIKELEFGNDTSSILADDSSEMINSMLDLIDISSPLEQNLLSLILDGYSNRNISKILKMSAKNRDEIISLLKEKMKSAFFGELEDCNSYGEKISFRDAV